ncbi:hypothetical protein R6Q59_016920 [Mikania micrantha]
MDEIETKNYSPVEKMTDKIHHDDSESEKKTKHDDIDVVDDDDDVKKPTSALKSKSNLFSGRDQPVPQVFGGVKPADVFLWRNKKISASILGGATALWVLFELLEYHLVTLVCHILILVFAVLFLWSSVSNIMYKSPPSIPEVRIPEDPILQFTSALRIEINHSLHMLWDIGSGRDLKKFLAVVAGLWVLSVVGRCCSFLTLVYTSFVVLQTVPVLYVRYKDEVDAFVEKAMMKLKNQYALFDEKVVSKIPRGPLKEKKKD